MDQGISLLIAVVVGVLSGHGQMTYTFVVLWLQVAKVHSKL